MVQLIIISLLGDVIPVSSAGEVSSSSARRRRQLPEPAGPTDVRPGAPASSRSVLLQAWLRAAADRARQRPYGDHNDVDMLLEERKRQPENDDIYLVRRRNSEHIDNSVRNT